MQQDPTSLDRLHDIVPPPAVPWWPPAPAWYWVLGLLCVAIVIWLLRAFMHWQRNRYRREALAECAKHQAALHDASQRGNALVGLAALLKRTAITAFPRKDVASLTGTAWDGFLDHTVREKVFSQGGGSLLEAAAYDPRSASSVDENKARELARQVHAWITHHRVDVSEGGAS
ncbi:DUF4381 domain-containing protein [Roseimicrobium sp. ORNL1]|uniref:DUF4381 domain-containing protein n=1 Tax=Roseimicrobium sp. ORNL1 TaxID=2711231 RepID=UPI0013E1C5A0|nr:DUF4381 domain-containing protein [Roseimicrobium sp. ORNL1]QIF05328.1 DUF4381 domain-containing protein [Roseimicrobium sp. ORNL1]